MCTPWKPVIRKNKLEKVEEEKSKGINQYSTICNIINIIEILIVLIK